MFDNSMTGAVGFAMHEARLATATRNLLLMEAEATGKRRQKQVFAERSRAVVARLLIALARRIMPLVPSVSTTSTGSISG